MKREKGMLYVCLGRCEVLDDIYIAGNLQVDGIACSSNAHAEANRLQEIFEKNVIQIKNDDQLLVSFLNTRSLRKHYDDIRKEPLFMSADLFSLCETWLNGSETVEFEGFQGTFANGGRGKGIAAFVKIIPSREAVIINEERFSSIIIQTQQNITFMFMYISKNANQDQILNVMSKFAFDNMPTAIIGDFNWDYKQSFKIKTVLEENGFNQVVTEPTHELGHTLDHVYLNRFFPRERMEVKCSPAHFSDHDIISLLFSLE